MVVVNIVFDICLVFPLRVVGLAVGFAVTGVISSARLYYLLRRDYWVRGVMGGAMKSFAGKLLIVAACTAAGTLFARTAWLSWCAAGGNMVRGAVWEVCVSVAGSGIGYGVAAVGTGVVPIGGVMWRRLVALTGGRGRD
jgi:peptidoglycan biosynthesis protein MviN/MurJ (putative lipid II flippase)